MSDWQADLDEFFERQEQLERAEAETLEKERLEVETFLSEIVVPAFEQLSAYLDQHGREVKIVSGNDQATITVIYEDEPEIMYRIYAKRPQPTVKYAYISQVTGEAVKATDVITTVEGEVSAEEISQEVIIQHFIRKYKSVA